MSKLTKNETSIINDAIDFYDFSYDQEINDEDYNKLTNHNKNYQYWLSNYPTILSHALSEYRDLARMDLIESIPERFNNLLHNNKLIDNLTENINAINTLLKNNHYKLNTQYLQADQITVKLPKKQLEQYKNRLIDLKYIAQINHSLNAINQKLSLNIHWNNDHDLIFVANRPK